MYIKEAMQNKIITKEALNDFEQIVSMVKKHNSKALEIKDKNGNDINIIKEYKKFLNSKISLEDFEELYIQFLINSFTYNTEKKLNAVKSEEDIVKELNIKANKIRRFAYIYIVKDNKDKYNPNLLKRTIENIQKEYDVKVLAIKDVKEMPMIYGVKNFPVTFIYNKDKISNKSFESPVEGIIEGYYL